MGGWIMMDPKNLTSLIFFENTIYRRKSLRVHREKQFFSPSAIPPVLPVTIEWVPLNMQLSSWLLKWYIRLVKKDNDSSFERPLLLLTVSFGQFTILFQAVTDIKSNCQVLFLFCSTPPEKNVSEPPEFDIEFNDPAYTYKSWSYT